MFINFYKLTAAADITVFDQWPFIRYAWVNLVMQKRHLCCFYYCYYLLLFIIIIVIIYIMLYYYCFYYYTYYNCVQFLQLDFLDMVTSTRAKLRASSYDPGWPGWLGYRDEIWGSGWGYLIRQHHSIWTNYLEVICRLSHILVNFLCLSLLGFYHGRLFISGRPYSACTVLTRNCQFVILSPTYYKKDQEILLTLEGCRVVEILRRFTLWCWNFPFIDRWNFVI